MGFKVFIYLSLLVAVALHISSDVAARDLVETSVDNKKGQRACYTHICM